MAKITKAQRQAINQALLDVSRALNYVMSDRIVVASKVTRIAGRECPDEYICPRDEKTTLRPLIKEYGSDLCALMDAQKRLQQLLS